MINGKNVMVRKKLIKLSDLSFPNNIFVTLNIHNIIKTLIIGDPVSGWPSLACMIMFVSGVQLFFLGIIGMYLSKLYLEVKKRPIYITKETEKEKKKEK